MSSSLPNSSDASHGESKVKEFGPPFDTANADIIIRSSDNCDFRVHRVILGLASVVFQDMFTVQPQPVSSNDAEHSDDFKDGLPIVCLTESSSTLHTLFKLIYPGDPPRISGRSHTLAVVKAMDKYLIEDYPNTITAALLNLSEKSPHVVLALAFRHSHLAHEVRVAAAHSTLKFPAILPSSTLSDEDVDLFSASQYRRLLVYHRECSQEALSVLAKLDWVRKTWAQASCGKVKAGIRKWEDAPEDCVCARSSRRIQSSPKPRGEKTVGSQRHIFIAEWAADFVSCCEAAVKDTPYWDTIKDISIRPSVVKAAVCDMCAAKAAGELECLTTYFVKHVRRAIEQVIFNPSA